MAIDYKAKEIEGERYAHNRDILLRRSVAEIDNSMDVVRRHEDFEMRLVNSYSPSFKQIRKKKASSA